MRDERLISPDVLAKKRQMQEVGDFDTPFVGNTTVGRLLDHIDAQQDEITRLRAALDEMRDFDIGDGGHWIIDNALGEEATP